MARDSITFSDGTIYTKSQLHFLAATVVSEFFSRLSESTYAALMAEDDSMWGAVDQEKIKELCSTATEFEIEMKMAVIQAIQQALKP